MSASGGNILYYILFAILCVAETLLQSSGWKQKQNQGCCESRCQHKHKQEKTGRDWLYTASRGQEHLCSCSTTTRHTGAKTSIIPKVVQVGEL